MYLITGGSGGLGMAICHILSDREKFTIGMKDCNINIDMSILNWDTILNEIPYPDVIIHCAGKNFIQEHSKLNTEFIKELIQINAISQFEINRHFLNRTRKPKQIVHVISDAAWTPMTHSLAYNMSKAAQLMMMRQMAHEDKRAIIYGVSPGKIMNTGMSKYIDETFPPMRGWTYEQGRDYQLSKLRTQEMSPTDVALFIYSLIINAGPHFHGHNFTIGG